MLLQKIGNQGPEHNIISNDKLLHYYSPPPVFLAHILFFSTLGANVNSFMQNQSHAALVKGEESV